MLRKLLPLLLLAPIAARASDRDDGQWSGDDQYSWQSDSQSPGDARDGYGPRDAPPPPANQYGARQDDWGAPQDDWGSRDDDRDSRPDDWNTRQDGWSSQQQQQYAPPPDEGAGPSMNDFRAGLDGYGRWVNTAEYGWVWQPTRVGYRWQPYWDGRWVWTTAGWTWVTDEPWGWATYHYGRWALLGGRGWVWLPGRVWAPAWVAWRWGGGYAGWCPLGPRGAVFVQPRTWVFVEAPNFLGSVRHHAVPVGAVATIWSRAQPMPVIRPSPRAGPPPRIVEQHTRVPVRAVPIVDAESRTPTRPLSSGVLPVWRPRTVPYPRPAVPASAAPARAQPDNPGVAGAWRQRMPEPQRPVTPAVTPRPSPPPGQAVRPVMPPVRPPETPPAASAPRAEREDREPSVRPHAQPLNGAREAEKK
jgi:hypothetical protein